MTYPKYYANITIVQDIELNKPQLKIIKEQEEDSKIRKEALILFDYSKLNGRIVEKFGSQRAFAKALGKSEVIISRKLCGKAGITTRDIATWSSDEFLDIPGDQIGDYFFKVKAQDSDQ